MNVQWKTEIGSHCLYFIGIFLTKSKADLLHSLYQFCKLSVAVIQSNNSKLFFEQKKIRTLLSKEEKKRKDYDHSQFFSSSIFPHER